MLLTDIMHKGETSVELAPTEKLELAKPHNHATRMNILMTNLWENFRLAL